ncbi:MBL fold metallo-hydrolase [Tateyamaria armeniaca]|uniref:MBL fold metallo-hydrolase n=1 Tax=Tateyamaria armeniaca TaxID=2518930 RepID=A0ABW8UVP5_9RHOB
MSTSALASVAVAGTSLPVAADAHASPMPVVQTHMVGAAKVTAISDGFLPIGPEALQGVDAETYAARLAEAHIKTEQHLTGVNAYLIETGDATVLVDAGTGTVMGPTLGALGASLAAMGTDPASITHLVATHLHPDHVGGVLVDGQNVFTGAELVVSGDDVAFWTNEEIAAGAPDGFKPFFELATGVVQSFGDRLREVSGEASIGAGLTAMPMPGHTPGHMGVMLESEGDQLLLWGDILHVPPVQLADPAVTIAFDADADAARATRASVLDMVATDGLAVAGAHISFPGIGYIEKAGSGYRWTAAPYPYG